MKVFYFMQGMFEYQEHGLTIFQTSKRAMGDRWTVTNSRRSRFAHIEVQIYMDLLSEI